MASVSLVSTWPPARAGAQPPRPVGSSTWTTTGYWLATSSGSVIPEGTAADYGSAGGLRLTHPVVGMATTPDGRGYWLVATDGGIFAFGDARYLGSTGAQRLVSPVVGMAATPDGHGYWLVAADGGIFTFGNAPFLGSASGRRSSPVVAMAPTPSGRGYWLLAANGTVSTFGDAVYYGSAPGLGSSPSPGTAAGRAAAGASPPASPPASAMAASPDGHGYWIVSTAGRVYTFGDAPGHGSAPSLRAAGRVVGMAAGPDAGGYLLAGADGGVFSFGSDIFRGRPPGGGVVALVAAPPRADPVVGAFYYPWYASMPEDGEWRHWDEGGHSPPADIGSDFYPARGAYSSSDPAVVGAQMAEMAAAGINEVIVSWWGQGSFEDERLPLVEQEAAASGLAVAIHIEPYPGRTAASVGGDISYLEDSYGAHDFFVYRAQDFTASEWAPVLDSLSGARVWAESFWDYFKEGRVQSFAAAAGFSGIYTYDPFDLSGTDFAGICGSARMDHLLCSPSVAPGFEAVRATGGTAVRSRQNGATYDQMWQGAIDSTPDLVTITSYNEWHEGSQIEPAVPNCPTSAFCYQSYEGAYGLSGAQASDAYLVRTQGWVRNYRAREGDLPGAVTRQVGGDGAGTGPAGDAADPVLARQASTPAGTAASWTIKTVAGTAGGALLDPVALALDGAGDLFVADAGNGTVDELAAGSTSLTRVAGTGRPGFSGDNGPAVSAQLDDPRGIALDSQGDIYIADYGNDRVREVDASDHQITTVAGGGGFGFSPDGTAASGAALEGPSGVAVAPGGQVVFSETSANRIRSVDPGTGRLATVAGTGAFGNSGDGGPALAAELAGPMGLTYDGSRNLIVTDPGGYDVREVRPDGTISTVAGSGTEGDAGDNGPAASAQLDRPVGVGTDPAGDVLLSEPGSQRVREVAASTGVIFAVAGTGDVGPGGDGGPALSARLDEPGGLAVDGAGDVFVADTGNHRVREFSPPAPGGCAGTVPVGTAAAILGGPGDGGYRLASSGGVVAAFGSAPCEGTPLGSARTAPVTAMAGTPDGGGYWLATGNGGVFSFGDAVFHGAAVGTRLSASIVGMAATPDGGGYWLVASDGGVFSFGDASFHGSATALHLNRPVVGITATPDGGGYWLVASDGGMFTYGNAVFAGSDGNGRTGAPVVGMAATPDGRGYWLVTADGGIIALGAAQDHGSAV